MLPRSKTSFSPGSTPPLLPVEVLLTDMKSLLPPPSDVTNSELLMLPFCPVGTICDAAKTHVCHEVQNEVFQLLELSELEAK